LGKKKALPQATVKSEAIQFKEMPVILVVKGVDKKIIGINGGPRRRRGTRSL
jgi:hypothetical protein